MSSMFIALTPLWLQWIIQTIYSLNSTVEESEHLIHSLVETSHRGALPFNSE